MKPGVKKGLIGFAACIVLLSIIFAINGNSESAGNTQIVNLGVVCVIGALYYLAILLISIFSKDER